MSEYTALRITRSAPAAVGIGPASYWLRIVQEEENDLVTAGEIAELVDELYEIDPCFGGGESGFEPVEEEAEEPTEEDLYRAAKDIFGRDLVGCRTALSGDYTAEIRIYRSHPAEAYRLSLSVGEVVRTVVASERIRESLDIKSAASVDLEYPVVGAIAAGWLGPVIGRSGLIVAPEVKRSGNTLYWSEPVTGTIRVDYMTTVDIVTVEIPGLPLFPGSDTGESQDAKILAFYHMMVFPGEIKKPVEDDTVTTGELRQLCGYNDDGELSDAGDSDAPLPAPPEPPTYGCQEWDDNLADPITYKAKCCEENSKPYACLLKTAPNPGGKSISVEEMNRFLAINPRTSFQPVTPPGADGCGTIYYALKSSGKDCCADITPLSPLPTNPDSVAPTASIILEVLDGNGPLFLWKTGGGLTFDGKTTIWGGHKVRVTADADFCDRSSVSVDDGCSRIVMPIENSNPPLPLTIANKDALIASPGGMLYLDASGGLTPYNWAGSGGLTLVHQSGLSAIFAVDDDFCGSGQVTVSDACTRLDAADVRSTLGHWITNGLYPDQFYCEVPWSGVVVGADGYATYGANRFNVSLDYSTACQNNGVCPDGNIIAVGGSVLPPEEYCVPLNAGWEAMYQDNCCYQRIPPPQGDGVWSPTFGPFHKASSFTIWVCPGVNQYP